MTVETEVVFPRSMRDIYPVAVQQLYIETYRQSWAKSVAGTANQLSPESVAVRDAWDAVKREYVEDPLTHKWRCVGDQATTEVTNTKIGSLLNTIKHLFRH